MFTSTVGNTFLKAYNQSNNTEYSVKKFYDEIFIPLFFDHNKYMMTAGNSPLENPKIAWEKMIKEEIPFESAELRQNRIQKMAEKIENEPIDASFAVGYPTDDETAGTSGQITTIDIDNSKDDVYLSWIGAALGIGIQGGFSILYNDGELLVDVFSGWKHYRHYLENFPKLRGNQINTWNGKWLCHLYDTRKYDVDNPLYGFSEPSESAKGLFEFLTVSWVKVITKIAQKKKANNYLGYIYNIGQTNTTLGFIPFELPQIRKPYELYRKLFGENDYLRHETKINELLGGEIGFKSACKKGAIGIEALEPKGLKAYMPAHGKKIKMPDYRKADEDQVITFNTYKIWVLAMLNNEELWEKSHQIARLLGKYESGADKARRDRTNNVEKFFGSFSRKTFIEYLIPIMENTGEPEIIYNVGEIVNKMTNEDVKYFVTLIRFQYANISKDSQNN